MTVPHDVVVDVRYFASVRAAAGVASDSVSAGTLAEALDAVRALHDERFATVLSVCALLVDGAPVGRRDPGAVRLAEGSVVEALPPFAGG